MLAGAPAGGSHPPGAVTLPTLREGGVRAALATIFIEPDGSPESIAYTPGDSPHAVASAVSAAERQLALYESWASTGEVRLGAWARAGGGDRRVGGAVNLGVLVEGADGIESPGTLARWVERGVVAVGLAWAKQTRYAGGNGCETGLTDRGREMVSEADRLGVVHDVSHLSDRSLDGLFSCARGRVMASHSNGRWLLDDGSLTLAARQRHLPERAVREIAARGGMIGTVLFSPFIIRGGRRDRRARLDEWYAHVEGLCEQMGGRGLIGLGSDADGGFSSGMLPEGIDRPSGFALLGETLRDRGWSDDEVRGFAWGNWARFWGLDVGREGDA